MSFLGDLVNSIGTDGAPIIPPKPFQRQTVPSAAVNTKPSSKPAQLSDASPPQFNALKRKSDDRDHGTLERPAKVLTPAAPQIKNGSRPSTPTANGMKAGQAKPASVPSTPANSAAGKAPPKGSYADIMARAKQAQEQRTTSKVGQIKHQATSREKISKVAERRREEQERLKTEKDKVKSSQRAVSHDLATKKRSTSPAKKSDQPKAPRAPRPPMHAPAGYKGTIGTNTKRPKGSAIGRAPQRSRYDEYLGTDEEDNSELEDEDEDGYGYGSDASSDMEAGWDELEGEEATALMAARKDDAQELATENKLKAEKEERRRKLAAMAKKAR